MRRTRTGLLLAAAACLVLTTGAMAQTGPTLSGATGLIETPNAETVPTGQFSFGLSGSFSQRVASPSLVYPPNPDDPLRYSLGRFGVSVAYGFTASWEVSLSFGALWYKADDRLWAGSVNGRERFGGFTVNETDKVRLGTKWVLNPKDPVRVAFLGDVFFPTGGGVSHPDSFSTGRTDFDLGLSFNYEWFTFATTYFRASDYGTPNPLYGTTNIGGDVPNEWTCRAGLQIPFVPGVFRGIFEINRVFYDGGQTKPPTYSEALLGGRVSLGRDSGLTAAGALRINIDRWVKYGSNPGNIGGVVQIAWSPQPQAPARPKVAAPPREELPATAPVAPPPPAPEPAPAPAPSAVVTEKAPAPRPVTSTTDEILFDPAKSRLTNIAKAILDGVALRLKNNLSATCTISATADPKEKGDRMALAAARAEAAKDYLVKRHGIDAGRIVTQAKGDGDSPDATRNRRAVVTVTFP